jgi:hypothetical protein
VRCVLMGAFFFDAGAFFLMLAHWFDAGAFF